MLRFKTTNTAESDEVRGKVESLKRYFFCIQRIKYSEISINKAT